MELKMRIRIKNIYLGIGQEIELRIDINIDF